MAWLKDGADGSQPQDERQEQCVRAQDFTANRLKILHAIDRACAGRGLVRRCRTYAVGVLFDEETSIFDVLG